MRARSAGDPLRSLAVLVVIGLTGACDNFTAPESDDLTDGRYNVTMWAPVIVNEFVTPEWMYLEPSVDFTIEDGAMTVTSSRNDVVATGPPQLFEENAAGWSAEFAWTDRQDGFHYWSVQLRGTECSMALAVDADLPGGVFTVELRRCQIERR